MTISGVLEKASGKQRVQELAGHPFLYTSWMCWFILPGGWRDTRRIGVEAVAHGDVPQADQDRGLAAE